jgi:hypothetical protein
MTAPTALGHVVCVVLKALLPPFGCLKENGTNATDGTDVVGFEDKATSLYFF